MDKIRKIIRHILNEVDDSTKTSLYAKSAERKPFDREKMKEAIESGYEIGVLFQSDNEDYTMKVSKYRIVQPVCMGMSKKGNLVIRAYQIIGQSEKKAIETGVRSAEAENEWRMLNAKNIKGFWLTGRTFDKAPPNYHANDKSMTSVIISFNPNKAKIIQNSKKPPVAEPNNMVNPETGGPINPEPNQNS